MLLHELYFDGLGGTGGIRTARSPRRSPATSARPSAGGPSSSPWAARWAAARAGWCSPAQPRDGSLCNMWAADHTHALAGGVPILALDMYEHSYHLDFGANVGSLRRRLHEQPRIGSASPSASPAPLKRRAPHMIDTTAARQRARERARPAGDRRPPGRRRDARPRRPARRAARPARQGRRGRGLAAARAARRWSTAPGASRSAATAPRKLRERGIDAVAVAGGLGAWRADGLPTEPLKEGDKS